MDSASQKLTRVISKEKQQNMDPASWKLTGEEKSRPTTKQVNACSVKLIGELMIQVFYFTWCALFMMESQRTSSPKDYGRTTTNKFSTHLMEYLKDSWDTGQTEDGSFNFKSIKEYGGSYSPPDPEHLESSYNLLTEWDP